MDEIDELLYAPGTFVCKKCGFILESKDAYPCPNDGETLDRRTWKDLAIESGTQAERFLSALSESVKLQSHYAELLNNYDGGRRIVFASVAAWMARLMDTGHFRKARGEWVK